MMTKREAPEKRVVRPKEVYFGAAWGPETVPPKPWWSLRATAFGSGSRR